MIGKRAYTLGMACLIGFLFVGAVVVNTAYTRHVQQQADRRHAEQQARERRAQQEARRQGLVIICQWLKVSIDPSAPPPTTARGRDQLVADQKLYDQFGCRRQ